MTRNERILAALVYATLCLGGIFSTGCQIDLGGTIGTKAFYPDTVGKSQLGDPRKPMYNNSGYTEEAKFGGATTKRELRPGEVPTQGGE